MALQTRNVKGQMSNSAAAVLTAGTKQTFIIQNITIANASGSDVSDIKFYIYPDGGSASNSTQVFFLSSLVDDSQAQVSLKHNLYNGDVLAAVAGTNTAVNYVISYAKRTD
tara:strand:- start:3569 stop:3901 length:333 start_codon:yes stop_codon:yes gene_type:complete